MPGWLPFNLSGRFSKTVSNESPENLRQKKLRTRISDCADWVQGDLDDVKEQLQVYPEIFNSNYATILSSLQEECDTVRREVSQVAMEGLDDLSGQLDILVIKTQAVLRNVSERILDTDSVSLGLRWKATLMKDGKEFEITFSSITLSKGGYGAIHRGSHPELGKLALKRANRPKNADDDRRRLREAAIWKELKHPHVLPLVGTCEVDDKAYLVAPYIEHGTLIEFVVNHPEFPRVSLLRDLASAISYLHSEVRGADGTLQKKRIIHGDMKPLNVLVGNSIDNPHVYLCDFGLSKAFGFNTSAGTQGQATLLYSSPERLLGGPRSVEDDVYGFGITIAEILRGSSPYPQRDGSLVSFIVAVTEHDFRPKTGEGVMWEIAKRCWVKEPGRRPTMDVVHGWIAAVAKGKKVKLPVL